MQQQDCEYGTAPAALRGSIWRQIIPNKPLLGHGAVCYWQKPAAGASNRPRCCDTLGLLHRHNAHTDTMTTFLALTAILLYLGSASLMTYRAVRGESYHEVKALLVTTASLALACHAAINYQSLFVNGGLDLRFFIVTSNIAWFIALIGLASSLRAPIDKLLIPVYGVAGLSIACLMLFRSQAETVTTIGPGVAAHILLSILAYSVMSLAACQAIILGIQNHELKARHIRGLLNALPPLQTMEHLLFEIIWVGMVLLTLSIASGIVFLEDVFAQNLAHKTFFTIAAWLIFAMLLWGRHQLGWRGQIATRWTLGGFAVLMLAYFGSKFILELVLQR